MIQDFDGMQKASQQGIDMAMESFGSMSQGLQALMVEAADYSKKNFETGSAALEKILTSSSVDKVVEAQSEYVKSTCEGYMAQMSKLGTMMTEVTRDACKPYERMFGAFPK
ncbi:MAG: phasin family protein [Candidatus Kaistia colombiensis]|nr:MAG: phasin family protein [Kaistia sp.]